MSKSQAEEMLALELKSMGLKFRREVQFHPTRLWRFDFANKELKLAVEVEGITSWGKNKDGSIKLGRHQTADGMERDLEKYSEAMILGWNVYRCSPNMIKSGYAAKTINSLYKSLCK